MLLPGTFRSLSRLSSALSAKASTLRPFLLNLWRIALRRLRAFLSLFASWFFLSSLHSHVTLGCLCLLCLPDGLPFPGAASFRHFFFLRYSLQYAVFKVRMEPPGSCLPYNNRLVGLSGLEPPTSRLSGVRSNRLSYKPSSFLSGTHLLSHAVSSIVPSAARVFTPVQARDTCSGWVRVFPPSASAPVILHY